MNPYQATSAGFAATPATAGSGFGDLIRQFSAGNEALTNGLQDTAQNGSFMQSDTWRSLMGGTDADGFKTNGIIPVGLQAGVGLGNLFMGIQANNLAKKQFSFQKEAYYTNLRNNITAFNNTLRDRVDGRWSDREKSQSEKDAIFNERKIKE